MTLAAPPDRVDRRGNPSGIALVALASSVPTLVDLVVSHILRLWELARAASSDSGLHRAHRRAIFNEHESLPLHILKERDVLASLPQPLNDLIAAALAKLVADLEAVLRLADGEQSKMWALLVGRSALERALVAVDAAHANVVRAVQLALVLGPSKMGDKAASSPACASSKPLQRAIAIRSCTSPSDSLKSMLSGPDVPTSSRQRLHIHSSLYHLKGDEEFLAEYRPYDPADHDTLLRVRDLCVLLSAAGHHSTALLSSRGFVPRPQQRKCEVLLPLPRGLAHPRTLRDLLLDPANDAGVRHPLAERIAIARRLVRAVVWAYAASGAAHCDVRPENVVCLFKDDDDGGLDEKVRFPWTLGTPFLVGLGQDQREGEWWTDVYQHPTTWGTKAPRGLLHDVYSLGVVLLEIALWRSFVLVGVDSAVPNGKPSVTSPIPPPSRSVTSPTSPQPMSGRPSQDVERSASPTALLPDPVDAEAKKEMLHRANSARVAAAALLGRAPPAIRPSTAQPTASSSQQQPFSATYQQSSFAFNLPSSVQPSHQTQARGTATATGRVRYKPNKLAVQFFGKDGRMRDGADVHKAFVRKAVEYVPLVLGERYRDAILTCLNALDGSFGSERLASVYLSGASGAQTSEDREFKEMLERLREVERSRGRTPEPSQNKGKKGKKKEDEEADAGAGEDAGAGADAEGRTREVAEACAVLMRVGTLLDEIQL